MSTMMSIGEFARRVGLSVSAVRFYGDRGLLMPTEIDALNGYRSYDHDQVINGELIRDLRRMDMPLAEIEQALKLPDQERQALVEGHLAPVGGDGADQVPAAGLGSWRCVGGYGGEFG